MRNFTIALWVAAIVLGLVTLGLSSSLDASYRAPSSQTSDVPYVNLEAYDIYALPDSIAICKLLPDGQRMSCLFPPNGSLLLTPREVRQNARRDST